MARWMVADSNYLRQPALETFLMEDQSNRLLFTEYTCIESYKGNAVHNIVRSTEIVSRYPSQIIVLHGARKVVETQKRLARRTERKDLIDTTQTQDFLQFCELVSDASLGNEQVQSQILEKGKAASDQLNTLLADSSRVREGILLYAKELDPTVRTALRRGDFPDTLPSIVVKNAIELAALFLRDHPDAGYRSSLDRLFDCYLFRYSLAGILLVVRWIQDGGIEQASPNMLANDIVDISHIAYGTYFDGLFTMERRMQEISEETTFMLSGLVREPAILE